MTIAWDSKRQVLVLFGGEFLFGGELVVNDFADFPDQLWEFDGEDWHLTAGEEMAIISQEDWDQKLTELTDAFGLVLLDAAKGSLTPPQLSEIMKAARQLQARSIETVGNLGYANWLAEQGEDDE